LQFCDGTSVPAAWKGVKGYLRSAAPNTPLMNRAYSECILSRIPQSVREVRELSSATTPLNSQDSSVVKSKASSNSSTLTGGHKLYWVNLNVLIVTAPVCTDVALYFSRAFYPFIGFTLYWSPVDSARDDDDDQILCVHIFAQHAVKDALHFLQEMLMRLNSPPPEEDKSDDKTGFYFCGLHQHVFDGIDGINGGADDRSMPESLLEQLLRIRRSHKVSLANLLFETAQCGQMLGTASAAQGGCILELHHCEFSAPAEAALVGACTTKRREKDQNSAGSLALTFRPTASFHNQQSLIDLLHAQAIDSIEMHRMGDPWNVTDDLMLDALMNNGLRRLSLSLSCFETANEYTSFIQRLRIGTLKNLTIDMLDDDGAATNNGSTSSLAGVLHNCSHLQHLRLTNCNIHDACWDEVMEILKCHPTLSTVEFVHVKIRHENASLLHVVDIISTNHNLEDFTFMPSSGWDDDFHRHAITTVAGILKANAYRKKVQQISCLEENIRSALVVMALSRQRLDPTVSFLLLRENVALMAALFTLCHNNNEW